MTDENTGFQMDKNTQPISKFKYLSPPNEFDTEDSESLLESDSDNPDSE